MTEQLSALQSEPSFKQFELGQVQIRDQEMLLLSREVLFSLAINCALSQARATQVATLISEISCQALLQNTPCQITFLLQSAISKNYLVMQIFTTSIKDIVAGLPIDTVFDSHHLHVEQIQSQGDDESQSNDEVQSHHENSIGASQEDIDYGDNCGANYSNTGLTGEVALTGLTNVGQGLVYQGVVEQSFIEQDFIEKQQQLFEKIKSLDVQFELRNNPHAIIQREKLSALGTFVAGTAHELNNPMMGILNYIQYALKHAAPEARFFSALKSAERETLRCVAIVQDLLRYSRDNKQGAENFEDFNITTLIQRILTLQKYRIKYADIEIITDFPDEAVVIPIKVNNIEQVLLNLLTNALDALEHANTKKLSFKLSTNSDYCVIEVEDSGCGMKAELIHQIYTPFFTTKKPGKGTGLGMSICKRIIEEHQGKIAIDSKVNKGTIMKVILPLKRSNISANKLKQ